MIAIFFAFNFFLLPKIFFISLYLTSLIIIGLCFSPAFLGLPMRCVLQISLPLIAKCKCSFIALIHSSSVFSCFFSGIPWSSKQLHLNIALVFPQLGHLHPSSYVRFLLSLFFPVRIYQTSWHNLVLQKIWLRSEQDLLMVMSNLLVTVCLNNNHCSNYLCWVLIILGTNHISYFYLSVFTA